MGAIFLALAVAVAPVKGAAPIPPSGECADAEWVSFAPQAPYDAAVADVAALVWLPNLLLPCPALFLGVGTAALKGPLPPDAQAPGIAVGHTIAIACCGPPLALSIVGLPLVWLETMLVAPASTLNALDRDVRCARRRAHAPPASIDAAPKQPPATMPPGPRAEPGDGTPRRDDPLPSPLPSQSPLPPPSALPQAMRY